jgi:hypothetical protein
MPPAGWCVTPTFVGAHWQRVAPFALIEPRQPRSPVGPARYGSAQQYLAQAQARLDLSATLTDEQKMIAEYWADGPNSRAPTRTLEPVRPVCLSSRPARQRRARR